MGIMTRGGGPTKPQFTMLGKQVDALATIVTIIGLTMNVENLLTMVQQLAQSVAANIDADAQGHPLSQEEIKQLVAQAVQAARSSTPASATMQAGR